MFVMAFDPGGTTGWASYQDESADPGSFSRGQIGPHEHHLELFAFLNSHRPDKICFEEFTYQIRNKNKYAAAAVNLISKEYIGVIKLYAAHNDVELVARLAAHAKPLWTDDKLKRLGLWVPSSPHAMDATRHLLAHLVVDLKMNHLLEPLRP